MPCLRVAADRYVIWWACAVVAASVATGCSRSRYRVQADREAYSVIEERNVDHRWRAPKYAIDLDPRSRYFDPYDPDRPPMPRDDPASHQYMRIVDRKKGWKHWDDNGHRPELENPNWREAISQYAVVDGNGVVRLDLGTAVRLTYIHSPIHQRQLETLYLTALDVTAERFRLDTQYFGGYGAGYDHSGGLIPSRLAFDGSSGKYIVTTPFRAAGVENNRVTIGRPTAGNPALQLRRRFATAGELLVGFANSFVFELTGGDASLSASLVNFSFIQPLLRGAGKDVALEQLTLGERILLANLRAYGQFRQGFFTQIAIGELGVSQPQRGGNGTTIQSFGGQGGVGGYLGLLQQLQEIRNSEDNLLLQQRTLARLEALLANEFIDIVQVDQFRQSVQSQRSSLLRSQNALELALDRYKTTTLGLPPDIELSLDESLIQQFQFIPREVTVMESGIAELQQRIANLPQNPPAQQVAVLLSQASELIPPVASLFQQAMRDVALMNEVVPRREPSMEPDDRRESQRERARLVALFNDLQAEYRSSVHRLDGLKAGLNNMTASATTRGLITWLSSYTQLVERFALIPAQARLESISVDRIPLSPPEAFQIALDNRLDFMNGRAALVDQWRLIQVNADALQSVLDLTTTGDVRTARNHPFSFRAPTGSFRLGLEFDAPFTRLLERNSYREALIRYQQSRRAFIQSRDALHLGIRALLRNLEQLRRDLEIQRQAVRIALRRVDQTQLSLSPPRQPPQPGQRAQISPTTAINLLSAQSSLLASQNAFLAVWLDYYATRMRLYRELGIMVLDEEGRWVEFPIGRGRPESLPSVQQTPSVNAALPSGLPARPSNLGIPQPDLSSSLGTAAAVSSPRGFSFAPANPPDPPSPPSYLR